MPELPLFSMSYTQVSASFCRADALKRHGYQTEQRVAGAIAWPVLQLNAF